MVTHPLVLAMLLAMFAMLVAPIAVQLVFGMSPLFGAWTVEILVPPP